MLELAALLGDQPLELALARLDLLLAAGDGLLQRRRVLLAAVEVLAAAQHAVLAVAQLAFERLELVALAARGLLELAARLQQLLLGGELGLAPLGRCRALGLLERLLGLAAGLRQDALGVAPQQQPIEHEGERHRDGDRTCDGCKVHAITPGRRDGPEGGSGGWPSRGGRYIPRPAVWAFALEPGLNQVGALPTSRQRPRRSGAGTGRMGSGLPGHECWFYSARPITNRCRGCNTLQLLATHFLTCPKTARFPTGPHPIGPGRRAHAAARRRGAPRSP